MAVARKAGAERDFAERQVAVAEKGADMFHLDAEDFVADGMADPLFHRLVSRRLPFDDAGRGREHARLGLAPLDETHQHVGGDGAGVSVGNVDAGEGWGRRFAEELGSGRHGDYLPLKRETEWVTKNYREITTLASRVMVVFKRVIFLRTSHD